MLVTSPAEGAEESSSFSESPPPSALELAELEREEREHVEWLSSPEAIGQREASRNAYADLSAGEARNLLIEAFPEQLQGLNADPARILSELEIEKALGPYGARVSTGEGESAIIESPVPVESEIGGEGKEPIDLTLERSGEDFVPKNPLTEVELPGSAGNPIQLQGGVRVDLPESGDHGAESLGDKNLFYPETDTATDTLISPIAGGAEVFEQLRSPESPEQFRFALDLPAGSSLRASQVGGAEVVSASGEKLVEVPPPTAVDAQGAAVPVITSVEGDSLVLDVPHRSREVAYPLLLDPRYNNGYESPPFSSSDWASLSTAGYTLSKSASSLAAISKGSNFTYGANTWGQWEYTAPGSTTYIENATFSNIYFIPHSCQTPQPHGYLGIYNVFSGSYNSLGTYATWESYSPSYYAGNGGNGTRKAIVGIGTGASSSTLSCAHELYVGGVTVQENDPENPTINSVNGVPGGWFDPAKVGSVTVLASDPGFGVDLISMSNQGGVTSEDHVGCTGMSGSRCPSQRTWTINPPYKEGERTLQVTAEDPTGKVGAWTTTTKVDLTKPIIDLEGQLAEVTRQEGEAEKDQELGDDKLRLSAYNLKIEAKDGSNAEAITKRSGVKDIALFLDGKEMEVPWQPQSCPGSSCSMSETYTVDLSEIEDGGVHKLKVIATDQVGLAREREIEFEYFPATGIKDEYVLQRFPLPDGEGDESEEENPIRPELAVNVANGNLVYRQQDVEVSGPAVDLEVERFYNSQLPESENTEWGDGWTLAQTPTLEPGETKGSEPPSEASMVRTSGALESAVGLPVESGDERFDKKLQATVTKEPDGGFEVTDESGETDTSLAFNEAGEVKELRTPGYAKVEYSYEGGDLSEIAVNDPASFGGGAPNEINEASNTPTPTATTAPATKLEAPQVTLNGYVDPNGEDTSYRFEYGPTTAYGKSAPAPSKALGSATSDVAVAQAIDDLEPGTTYHFRLVAENNQGTATGKDEVFTTPEWAIASSDELKEAQASVLAGSSCTSATACTAVGNYTNGSGVSLTLAERRVGGEWQIQTTPNPEGAKEARLTSVSCTSVTTCTAAGYYEDAAGTVKTLAERWNGSSWSILSTPNPAGALESSLESISCTSASDCTAAGHYKTGSEAFSTLIEHYNGSTWTISSTPNAAGFPKNYLSSVSCASSSECWAVGHSTHSFAEEVKAWGEGKELKPQALALHYNGSTWTIAQISTPPSNLAGISCTSASFCMAVVNEGLKLELFNGSSWSAATASSPPGGENGTFKAVSCASATACTAVGNYSAGGHGAPLAEHWDGSEWVAEEVTDPLGVLEGAFFVGSFQSVSCATASACAATGYFYDESFQQNLVVEAYSVDTRPLATSEAAGEVKATEATLSATVNPRGLDTAYQFEYGPTPAYGSEAPISAKEIGSGTSDVKVNKLVDSLSDGTTYHFRVVAESSGGTQYGKDQTFTTTRLPTVVTEAASDVTGTEATLHAIVNPRGASTDYQFEYGATDTYGTKVPASAKGVGSGESNVEVDETLGDLAPNTTYHFRVVAQNAAGTVAGKDQTLTTLKLPTITLNAAADITGTIATLSATVNPHGLDTAYQFEYGPTPAYGSEAPISAKDIGSGNKGVDVSDDVEGLEPSRPYHFRLVAMTQTGTAYSRDLTFTTPPPAFGFSFGSSGSGDGQLGATIGAMAVDVEGHVYVADSANHRVEKFSASGQYLDQFGKEGSGNGQFDGPFGGVAIDPEGDIYVADAVNHRIERFSANGEYLAQFGSAGTGNGQLGATIGGVAIDPEGQVYVADTANHRIEKFGASGEYLDQFGSAGSGNGQLGATIGGIAIDPEGPVYVADTANHRIEKFSASGQYLAQFGSAGAGNGQLGATIGGVAVDYGGNAWVVDSDHNRLEEFSADGQYLSQLGEAGSGDGQFSSPQTLAIDSRGSILIGDPVNSRVQKWFISRYELSDNPPPLPADHDPKVKVDTPGGLVDSVEGEAAGQTTYEHEGEMLTAVASPQGETQYEYDAEERLTRVELPNGTWGEIQYDGYGRVKVVTVHPAGGTTKTTHFNYTLEPSRRTVVSPEGDQTVTYDIGEDGSVLKWWNALKAPEIEELSGSLYAQRGEIHPEPISIGDQTLLVQAHSEEGIASVEIIANGNQLVDEKTCTQDYSNSETECIDEAREWVTNTESWAPGVLQLEVVVTDSLGQVSSERFWVNVPYTPPPGAEAPDPPKFADVLHFREEFGLDLDLKGRELAINERIFDLISAWHNPNSPVGEVARASAERWGVPLRPEDVAELEYRERYLKHNGPLIAQWGEDNHANTYAGYWMDHRHGGIIRVGFTSNQAATVSDLKQSGGLEALDRVGEFGSPPAHPVSELVSLQGAIGTSDGASGGSLAGQVTRVGIDLANNVVTVGATNTGNVSAALSAHYGAGAPIGVYADSAGPQSVRYTDEGPIKGGQIVGKFTGKDVEGNNIYDVCTAGPGAWERMGAKPSGEAKIAYFLLTAGHCFKEGASVVRFHETNTKKSKPKTIGEQRSRKWQIYADLQKFETDGEAIRLENARPSPRIVAGAPVQGAGPVRIGMTVCESLGFSNARRCEAIKKPAELVPFYPGLEDTGPFWQVSIDLVAEEGDSGSPVYSPDSGEVVGIHTFGPPSLFTPLLAPPLPEKGPFPYLHPSHDQAPGLLNESFMGNLHLVSE